MTHYWIAMFSGALGFLFCTLTVVRRLKSRLRDQEIQWRAWLDDANLRCEEYHRLADERLLALEPMKLERDEWEQRCIFLTQKLVEYERRGAV